MLRKQSVSAGGKCVPSHVEHKAEDNSWVKNEQNIRHLLLLMKEELSISWSQ